MAEGTIGKSDSDKRSWLVFPPTHPSISGLGVEWNNLPNGLSFATPSLTFPVRYGSFDSPA